jgi:hypothetical protein
VAGLIGQPGFGFQRIVPSIKEYILSFSRHLIHASIAATCLAALPADASVVSFTNLKGSWSNANPAANIDFISAPGVLAQVRWGNAGSNDSGYDFSTVGSATVNAPSSPFILGTFTHINQPVSDSINAIRLTLTTDLAIDSVSKGNLAFVFNFFHDETPNNAKPCAYGGANGQGVNINGCADRVTTAYNTLSQTFLVGSDAYTIDVLGFKLGSDPVKNEFLTLEQNINRADLLAQVKLRSEVNVPEPGTLGLIGLSMVCLGANGLKRRRT